MAMKGTDRWQRGGSRRKFCYTYRDIADKKGVTIHAVRQAVKRGTLKPADLESVTRYIQKKKGKRECSQSGRKEK